MNVSYQQKLVPLTWGWDNYCYNSNTTKTHIVILKQVFYSQGHMCNFLDILTGKGAACPNSQEKPDKTPCEDNSVCYRGVSDTANVFWLVDFVSSREKLCGRAIQQTIFHLQLNSRGSNVLLYFGIWLSACYKCLHMSHMQNFVPSTILCFRWEQN